MSKKTVQDNPSPIRNSLYGILMDLYKFVDIGDKQKIHIQFRTAVKSLPRDSLGNKPNCDHPDIWEPYFRKPLLM